MAHMTWEELRQLPSAVDLETAGRALGIGRSKIYEMARTGELQQIVKVLKLGHAYRVVTADLYRVLGVSLEDGLMPSATIATDLHVAGDPARPEQAGRTDITRALRSPDRSPEPGMRATRRATRRAEPDADNAAAS